MTKFEKLMEKSNLCCQKAIEFAQKGDWNMASFFKNASIGFEQRARNLTIGELYEVLRYDSIHAYVNFQRY